MDPSRWDRLEDLLARATEVPVGQRAAFVERETGDDPELGTELWALLAASEGADDYMERLRDELLGSQVPGLLHDERVTGEGSDPWIGRTISHYQITDRIGGGGMGIIYRARDLRLERPVALKFIAPEIRSDPTARRRFLHEARAASALDHPNICTIHEIAETDDGRSFIVMAAYEGETLRARLVRGPLPEADALDIGEQIARALAAAHERGIVHRDVKPDNVFVTREGVVKLLDFGLAHTVDGRMSGSASAEGTVAYMSPEQLGGDRADERSDTWALGVILFEMLAGVRPFAAEDPAAATRRILTEPADLRARCPDLPGELVTIVHQALSKGREARFANGLEALEAVRDYRRTVGRARRRRWTRSRRGLWPGAGVLGGLVVVLGVALTIRTDRDSRETRPASLPVSHVLWVDDNPENNIDVVQQLRDLGVEVTTALNTTDALRLYDPSRHQLVVSDIGRYEGPGGAYVARAGLAFLTRLRARHAGAPLVFCTSARGATVHRAEALAAGALDVVTDCEAVLRLIGF